MEVLALVRQMVHPRTDTPEAAWKAAANSAIAGAILGANRMLFGGFLLFTPAPVMQGLVGLGVGFVYVILARLALGRSRLASGAILVMAVLEALIELSLAPGYRFNLLIVGAALILAVGGYRGANAVYTLPRKTGRRR